MNVRKCWIGEIDNIINLANNCFIPDRAEDFTFIKSVPYVYNNSFVDYSDIHFIVEEDGKGVAVGANLKCDLYIGNGSYKISRVGTIGTLSEYRNKGYMRAIMSEIDKENKDEDVVFSVLMGNRDLYNKYGYERACLSCNFVFEKERLDSFYEEFGVLVRGYNDSDIDELYRIYKNNEKIILRSRDDFSMHFNQKHGELYTIEIKGKIIGYCAIKDNAINEISLDDNKYLESVVVHIYNNMDCEDLVVCASMLHTELFNKLNKLASYRNIYERLCIKVYDLKNFLNLLYLLNRSEFVCCAEEVYQIGNVIYEISVNGNGVVVEESNKVPNKVFESEFEFLRFVLGSDLNDCNSNIFPLYFDLSVIDKF